MPPKQKASAAAGQENSQGGSRKKKKKLTPDEALDEFGYASGRRKRPAAEGPRRSKRAHREQPKLVVIVSRTVDSAGADASSFPSSSVPSAPSNDFISPPSLSRTARTRARASASSISSSTSGGGTALPRRNLDQMRPSAAAAGLIGVAAAAGLAVDVGGTCAVTGKREGNAAGLSTSLLPALAEGSVGGLFGAIGAQAGPAAAASPPFTGDQFSQQESLRSILATTQHAGTSSLGDIFAGIPHVGDAAATACPTSPQSAANGSAGGNAGDSSSNDILNFGNAISLFEAPDVDLSVFNPLGSMWTAADLDTNGLNAGASKPQPPLKKKRGRPRKGSRPARPPPPPEEPPEEARAVMMFNLTTFHDWVLALGTKERNMWMKKGKLNSVEQVKLLTDSRKYKQRQSKQNFKKKKREAESVLTDTISGGMLAFERNQLALQKPDAMPGSAESTPPPA